MSQTPLEPIEDRLSAAAEHLSLDVDLTFKPMFGGISAYVSGRVFASLSNVGLALKLSTADQETLLAEAGAKRLQYEPDAPESKQYIVVPEAIQDTPEQLAAWVKLSVDYVMTLPAPKPKKKPD